MASPIPFPSLFAALKRRSDAFEAFLDAAETVRPCAIHPGRRATLDREASFESRRLEYRCPACEADTERLALMNKMAALGVPARVRHATFENFDVSIEVEQGTSPFAAWTHAIALHNGELVNLVLCGTPGVGKGHLAAAVMRARLDSGQRGNRWITAASYFRSYHAAYADGAHDSLVRFYSDRPLLVIDEMGLGQIPKDGELALSELFDARWNAARPTILISNRTPADLSDNWLGARVADRLREKSAVLWLAWKSYRETQS